MKNLCVVIVNFNTKEILQNCLESIFQQQMETPFEVCVVDNASTDGSVEFIKKNYPHITLIENDENKGFARANNQGIKEVTAQNYLLLNSDTILHDKCFDILLKVCSKEGFNILSPKILNKDKTLQPNVGDLPSFLSVISWLSGLDDIFRIFKIKIDSFHIMEPQFYHGTKKVGWIAGTAFLITRKTIEKIGLLDEKIFMYAEDTDYCYRAKKAGLVVGWTDQASLIHLGGASSKNPRYAQWLGEFRGLLYFYKKHYSLLVSNLLKGGIFFFVALRIIVFSLIGKLKYAKEYAKIIISL